MIYNSNKTSNTILKVQNNFKIRKDKVHKLEDLNTDKE